MHPDTTRPAENSARPWIEGERIWNRADPLDRLYQTGGFQVAERYPTPPEHFPIPPERGR